MKRQRHVSIKCAVESCPEYGHFEAENAKDAARISQTQRGKWKCTRHRNPEALLSLTNRSTVKVLTAQKIERSDKNFWNGTFGLVSGDGYKAFANDFPEGTKLIITSEIILP